MKALLPQLKATLPQGLAVSILSDRTETVRASVDDVQFTLILTIILVVAVIAGAEFDAPAMEIVAGVPPSVEVPRHAAEDVAEIAVCGMSLDPVVGLRLVEVRLAGAAPERSMLSGRPVLFRIETEARAI